MTSIVKSGAAALLGAAAAGAAELPEGLRTAAGARVESAADWEQVRRPEVLELFRSHVYGRSPVERPASLRVEAVDAGTPMMEAWLAPGTRLIASSTYTFA